ncbi:hypothetical protein DRO34_04370 [Candidatus Bathyarchaeota archaeon]|nr:MAG: hypothetical protein DRO34_04370 [Candidatus Bathyarchaeota archaeon]
MPAIRSAQEIAEKWARVTPGRSSDYEAGVKSPKKDWETETANAESAWEGGIQNAIAEKRFVKGVREAGTAKWQAKATTLGVSRWGPGVAAAKDDYARGFAPYRDIIERITLPPRKPKGDPSNIDRVRIIAMALHEAKVKG